MRQSKERRGSLPPHTQQGPHEKDLQRPQQLGIVAYACTPRTGEAEAGELI